MTLSWNVFTFSSTDFECQKDLDAHLKQACSTRRDRKDFSLNHKPTTLTVFPTVDIAFT
jgi:hypothetical protein